MAELRWKVIGETMLIVHTRKAPPAAEWDEYIAACWALGHHMQRCLVLADISLSPTQRTQVADVVKAAGTTLVVVVTTSAVARGAVTALGWMTGVHKAFSPRSFEAAVSALGVGPLERAALVEAGVALARELGVEHLAGRSPPQPRYAVR